MSSMCVITAMQVTFLVRHMAKMFVNLDEGVLDAVNVIVTRNPADVLTSVSQNTQSSPAW